MSETRTLIGKELYRINVCAFTEMIDLLGSDYLDPKASEDGDPTFKFMDGPLLTAIKHGHWFLLDEMNLASQTMLEGLNALLDHRRSVYVQEKRTEYKAHPEFVYFATQNPSREGSGRNPTLKSTLNRFVRIRLEEVGNDAAN